MKKVFFSFAVVAVAAIALAACGNKSANAQAAEGAADGQQAEAAVPDGFKTHEFAHFAISLPQEFKTSYEAESDNVTFDSDSIYTLEDGTEVSSSANVNCGFMTGGATPSQVKETAQNLKLGQEATGETCDEPKIDGNIILMRHWYQNDDEKVITWRWWIVSESGNNIAGNIYFPESQAKLYEPYVEAIVKSIKFK